MFKNDDFPPLSSHVKKIQQNSVWNNGVGSSAPAYHQVPPPASHGKISFTLGTPKKKKVGMGSSPFRPNAFVATPRAPPPTKPPPGLGIPSPQPAKQEYPDTLMDYIHRAFQQANNQEERAWIDSQVKFIISQSIQRNKLWTCNWKSRPLPKLPTKQTNKPVASSLGKRAISLSIDEEEFSSESQKQNRMKRFEANESKASPVSFAIPPPRKKTKFQRKKEIIHPNSLPVDPEDCPSIIGTCTNLEKSFYRLVTEPDPSLVRPEWVLKKSLAMLKRKWKKQEVDYVYICDQFKSIRQDMTMQRIKNNFTVNVYETHARLALENGDLNEFNQCQTKLKTLYESGKIGNSFEFAGYRILYLLHTAVFKNNFGPLLFAIQQLTQEEIIHPFISHALQVKESLITRNHVSFFRLYKNCPNMGVWIMRKIVEPIRLQGLRCIVKAYFPKLSVKSITSMLGFSNEKEAIMYLREHGAKLIKSPPELGFFVDTKKSSIH